MEPRTDMTEAKQVHLNPAVQTAQEIINTVKELLIEKPVSAKEAAEYMGICQASLYRQISRGQFPAQLVHKSLGRHYFFLSEIREYLKGQ